MPRVLTVDDSKALRTIVSRQIKALGLDVESAEDGVQGLQVLATRKFDLVLLDVTMPNLDGPGMLKQMRERGDRTPVIMLTSEAKTSIISECMKLGIEDYILKPFTPDEIKGKVCKALGMSPADIPGPGGASDEKAAEAAPPRTVDILLIDDMENVHKKFRSLLPEAMSMDQALDASNALQACREKIYRVVLIDSTLPDVDSVSLLNQIKILQGTAIFLSLSLRSKLNVEQEAIGQGFKGVVFKPFDSDTINDMMANYFDSQNIVAAQDDVIRLLQYSGREEKIDKYYAKAKELSKDCIQNAAAACFEAIHLDLTVAPLRPDGSIKLILDLHRAAKKLGLELRLIGTDDAKKLCSSFTDTAAIPFYPTIEAARAR